MKILNLLVIVAIILVCSLFVGCAATKPQVKASRRGYLTTEQIEGTDLLTPPSMKAPNPTPQAQGNQPSAVQPAGRTEERLARLENDVKRLSSDQLKISAVVIKNTERITKLEKYRATIQRGAEVAKAKHGPNALPSIELKDGEVSGFKSGDYQLSDNMKLKIEALSEFIKKSHADCKTSGYRLRVLIEGWADIRGDAMYNEMLSRNRAIAARIHLKSLLTEEENNDIVIDIKGMGAKLHVGSEYRYVVFRLYRI